MHFETFYQELETNAPMIRALASGLTQAEARLKPDPASWSVLEVICHLYDEEREDFRARLDHVLHHPQDKWSPNDPEGWVAARRYNERDLPEMLDKFVLERAQSLAWLRSLSAPDWETAYIAPWGPLKAGDILTSWAAHDNLAMRQLVELRRYRIASLAEPYDLRYAGEW
jgi:DinB superfamily